MSAHHVILCSRIAHASCRNSLGLLATRCHGVPTGIRRLVGLAFGAQAISKDINKKNESRCMYSTQPVLRQLDFESCVRDICVVKQCTCYTEQSVEIVRIWASQGVNACTEKQLFQHAEKQGARCAELT